VLFKKRSATVMKVGASQTKSENVGRIIVSDDHEDEFRRETGQLTRLLLHDEGIT
jgi:hypothetical protein